MVTEALLPIKVGYVEVEANDKRTYRNAVTGILIDDEVPKATEVEVLSAKIEELKAAMGVLAASVVMEG